MQYFFIHRIQFQFYRLWDIYFEVLVLNKLKKGLIKLKKIYDTKSISNSILFIKKYQNKMKNKMKKKLLQVFSN